MFHLKNHFSYLVLSVRGGQNGIFLWRHLEYIISHGFIYGYIIRQTVLYNKM
jgi:hypothetical protein